MAHNSHVLLSWRRSSLRMALDEGGFYNSVNVMKVSIFFCRALFDNEAEVISTISCTLKEPSPHPNFNHNKSCSIIMRLEAKAAGF